MDKKENPLTEPIECILWDFDNTLYRPNEKMDIAIKKLLYQEVENKTGNKEPAPLYEGTKLSAGGNVATLMALHMDPITYSKIFREVATDYLKEDKELIGLFDSLDKYEHMLVTNNSTPVVTFMCGFLGLQPFDKYFRGVIGLENLLPDDYKPSKKPWEKALNATNMIGSPQRCLAVGDDMLKDIVPAKSLGMYTAFITWGNADFDSEIPHFYMDEVYKIEDLLNSVDIVPRKYSVPMKSLEEFDGKEEDAVPKGGIEEAVRGKLEMAEEEKKAEEQRKAEEKRKAEEDSGGGRLVCAK